MLREGCVQHSNISRPSPSLPPASCDYVATMLRPVLRATSNIRSPLPPPRHKPNIACLQHRNSTSATLKFNVYNTQQHVSATSRLDPQHQKSMFTTSKIFRSNFETFAWDTCNMPRTRMQHVHNDCNINGKRLHLRQYIDIKPMQH
jgi:hypothetical protein